MFYRKEIDGLRALAVIPVILFHANIDYFKGGFIGVDIFFVISGYLITSIILSDIADNKFSYKNFYERRIRRIAPALFLVIACCLPFSILWLGASDLKNFSLSLLSVMTFLSNVMFWRDTGYFDASAETKPLLHTWSLSVEEQFYVLFPAFLILIFRHGRNLTFFLLSLIALISLYLTYWGSLNNPSATFFLLPTRAWELCLGALSSFYIFKINQHQKRHPSHHGDLLNSTLSTVGLLLIAYSWYYFSTPRPFPSLYTLLPTIGTTLIIFFSNEKTLTGKILGTRLLVGVGLISYSAYLWHQPLFAFARHGSFEEPSTQLFLGLSISSLLIAILSWRFVEQPFRNKTTIPFKNLVIFYICCTTIFILFGLTGLFTNGVFFRSINPIELKIIQNHGLNLKCEGIFPLPDECRTSGEPEILLWGDSNAMHLAQAIASEQPKIKLVQGTMSVCGPFLDLAPISSEGKYGKDWAEKCIKFNDEIYNYIKNKESIKYVVMSSLFRQYFNNEWGLIQRDGTHLTEKKYVYDYFLSTLKQLEAIGKIPIIVSPTPQDGRNIGRCILKATIHNEKFNHCNLNLVETKTKNNEVVNFLNKINESHEVIWLSDAICRDNICNAVIDDTPIYADSGHLTPEGSALVGKKINIYQRILSNNHANH